MAAAAMDASGAATKIETTCTREVGPGALLVARLIAAMFRGGGWPRVPICGIARGGRRAASDDAGPPSAFAFAFAFRLGSAGSKESPDPAGHRPPARAAAHRVARLIAAM
ncbi:MAG TPA: hypothetical protein VK698_17430, partial [Kofleriaceae bacterium]|nr:hypothetical protein [Kofleriaceae bacterium]